MLCGRDGVFALYGAANEVGHAVAGLHFRSADTRRFLNVFVWCLFLFLRG